MKKAFAALMMLCIACVCMIACSNQKKLTDSAGSQPETEPAAETQAETETAAPEVPSASERAEQFAGAQGQYVFDECGMLSEEEKAEANSLAASLSAEKYMQSAVVITDDLGGASPAAFAAEYYNTLYGKNSTGFLVLINNDTNEDYVHTSGACSLYLTQDAVSLAIAKATPQLVEGQFAAAADGLLRLGEAMPQTIYDRSNLLSREQYDAFLAAAQSAMEGKEQQYSVLLVRSDAMTQTSTETTDGGTAAEDAAKALRDYANAQCEVLQADALLVICTDTMQCAVSAGFPDAETVSAELTAVLQGTDSYPVTAAVTQYYETIKG